MEGHAWRGLAAAGFLAALADPSTHPAPTSLPLAETEHTTAVLLEPLRPFLVTADSEGVLRVSNYRSGACANRFHASTGAPAAAGGSAYARAAGAQQTVGVRALYQVGGRRWVCK